MQEKLLFNMQFHKIKAPPDFDYRPLNLLVHHIICSSTYYILRKVLVPQWSENKKEIPKCRELPV